MSLGAAGPVAIAAPWRDPLDAFAPLCEESYALLLGPGGGATGSRWTLLLARPDAIHEASGAGALQGLPPLPPVTGPLPPLPFVGGYAGLACYELGASLDRVPRLEGGAWPDIALGHYPCAALFDHQDKALWVVGPDTPKARRFAALLGDAALPPPPPPAAATLILENSRAQVQNGVAQVRALIAAGDIFQANISQGFVIDLDGGEDAWTYFRRLCAQSPAPFGGFFRRKDAQALVSNSPERFFKIDADGLVQTSPIKGTRPRHDDPVRDKVLAQDLVRSAKDRAENLMIVDLMRNDLSRVCMPGSVRVEALCALHSYANVHHLVSTVTGRLAPGQGAMDVLAACFPAGSITGAPKVRAMQVIAALEGRARGPYCGALGYISRHGAADFSVLIRTAEHGRYGAGWRLRFRTGGGIVADSDPAMEVDEMLDKARALSRAAGVQL